MEQKKTELARTVFCITQRCTLKCKLCLAFMPYYDKPKDVTYEDAVKILDSYFKIVDTVNSFTITGGEPLMHKDLVNILREVNKYSSQIRQRVDIVTNATLDFSDELLDFLANKNNRMRVVLSDYGELSYKINDIVTKLKQRDIEYRISNFHGDDLYFDGWIDFTDHSLKITDKQKRDEHSQKCIHSIGKYFLINEGELHSCSRSYWRMRQGIIPRCENEYISLLDDSKSIEYKREVLEKMCSQKSSTSCAYCVGLRNDVERHYPAEQL